MKIRLSFSFHLTIRKDNILIFDGIFIGMIRALVQFTVDDISCFYHSNSEELGYMRILDKLTFG